jgi:hypothetical protein
MSAGDRASHFIPIDRWALQRQSFDLGSRTGPRWRRSFCRSGRFEGAEEFPPRRPFPSRPHGVERRDRGRRAWTVGACRNRRAPSACHPDREGPRGRVIVTFERREVRVGALSAPTSSSTTRRARWTRTSRRHEGRVIWSRRRAREHEASLRGAPGPGAVLAESRPSGGGISPSP